MFNSRMPQNSDLYKPFIPKTFFRVSRFRKTFHRNVNLKLPVAKEQDQTSGQRRKNPKKNSRRKGLGKGSFSTHLFLS